jgi:hypothetical protein
MLPPYIDLMTEISKRYYQERFKAAHTFHLLRQAGITHESRICRISLRLFVSLGHLLVALGHRLEGLEIKPPHQRIGERDLNKQNGFTLTRS